MDPLPDQPGGVAGLSGATVPQPLATSRPDRFLVTGAVNAPGTAVCTTELDQRARGPYSVHYLTRTCDRVDTVYGVALHELITGIGLRLSEAHKMDRLTFVILARGQDGYQVVLSWGEIDPEFGGCAALLATRYNDVLLPRPTLVLPHDDRGSRYVRMVSELRLLRMAGDDLTLDGH